MAKSAMGSSMGPIKAVAPVGKMKKGAPSPAITAAKKARVKSITPKASLKKPPTYKV